MIRLTSAVTEVDITNFSKNMKEKELKNGIIVCNKGLSNNAEKLLKQINLSSDDFFLEFFKFDDLLINISKHELVPKHELCSEEEKRLVLKKYRAKETQLPKILQTDPMARYLGARKGELVKINRDSETAGQYIVYRIVI